MAVLAGAGGGGACWLLAEEEAAGRWVMVARSGPGVAGPGGEGLSGPGEWTVGLQSQVGARTCSATRACPTVPCAPAAARGGGAGTPAGGHTAGTPAGTPVGYGHASGVRARQWGTGTPVGARELAGRRGSGQAKAGRPPSTGAWPYHSWLGLAEDTSTLGSACSREVLGLAEDTRRPRPCAMPICITRARGAVPSTRTSPPAHQPATLSRQPAPSLHGCASRSPAAGSSWPTGRACRGIRPHGRQDGCGRSGQRGGGR